MINVLSNLYIPCNRFITAKTFGREPKYDLHYDYVENFSLYIKKIANEHHFDAVFIFYPEYMVIPPGLDDVDIPVIALVSDWNLGFYPLQASLFRFDLVISDKKGTNILPLISAGVPVKYWNMYSYDPHHYSNLIIPSTPDYDVLFIGNVIPSVQKERSFFLRRLLKMDDKLRVKVATNIRGQDYINELAKTKIVFNRSIRSEANMRVFESLAMDKMILIEESNGEITDLFEPNRECVLYSDENLEEILQEYSENDEKRDFIVKNAAKKKVLYSYPAMVEKLANIIIESGVLSGARFRKTNLFSLEQRQYYELVQQFYATSVPASESVLYSLMKRILQRNNSSIERGLFIKLQYLLARANNPISSEVLKICEDIYLSVKQEQLGRVWNAYNYASLMEAIGNLMAAESILLEVLEFINCGNRDSFAGIPCFFIGEEWFQEFNMDEYRYLEGKVSEKKELLTSIVLTKIGHILLRKGAYSESATTFRKAVDIYHANSDAAYWYGTLTFKSNANVGYRYIKAAYENNAFNPNYWGTVVQAAKDIGRNNEAVEFVTEMKRIKPLADEIYASNSVVPES